MSPPELCMYNMHDMHVTCTRFRIGMIFEATQHSDYMARTIQLLLQYNTFTCYMREISVHIYIYIITVKPAGNIRGNQIWRSAPWRI